MAKSSHAEFDIYDFDKTIYDGDCSIDFWRFCVRNKKTLLKYLPYQVGHMGLFAAKLEDRTSFKEHFFSFLQGLDETGIYVGEFWAGHFKKIVGWYLELDHSRDIIISASPEFLVLPAFEKLAAHTLIATRIDPRTGKIDGENCRGQEKVRRLREILGKPVIRRAYSDSLSDLPMLRLAREPHLVERGKPSPLHIPDPLD